MRPRRVFVDTGAWYALQVADDEWHVEAAETMRSLLAGAHSLVTTNHVVGETYMLLRITSGHAAAVRFLDRTAESRRLETIFVSEEAKNALTRFCGSTPIRTSASSMQPASQRCARPASVTRLPSTNISQPPVSCAFPTICPSHNSEVVAALGPGRLLRQRSPLPDFVDCSGSLALGPSTKIIVV